MHVFNIPPSAPFLRTVISALVDGRLVDGFDARSNPARLAEATLYLPTRRAMRLSREIFLDVMGTDAVMLPRILPLGEIDEDELAFAQFASQDPAASLDLPPVLRDRERRLTLAKVVAAWAKTMKPINANDAPLVVSGPASALALADDLARLMDDMTTRGLNWDALDTLVPEEHDRYWACTLEFLKIARSVWPDHLKERGVLEAAARRDLLIEAEGRRLAAHPDGPVIAAGSTGSMPATARFLRIVANLPNGAVVLPGLDIDLDEAAWRMIGITDDPNGKPTVTHAPSHPQFALHNLLDSFGIERRDVQPLASPAMHGRERLTSEAMRPSDSTALWHAQLKDAEVAEGISQGMTGLSVIEAPNPELEALAIAVAMREAHEKKMTAALVTPDRSLARRVLAALDRWKLVCDDSGGDLLIDTRAGLFARLAAEVVAENFAPAPVLALLKHPLCRIGISPERLRECVHDLELALLRGTRPAPDLAGLNARYGEFRTELGKLKRKEASTLHRSAPGAHIPDYRLDAVGALIDRIASAFAPLTARDARKAHDIVSLAADHRTVLENLSIDDNDDVLIFDGTDGRALLAAFDDIMAVSGDGRLAVRLDEYPDVLQALLTTSTVRRPEISHAPLRIYGPLEARLTSNDRVILGGLTEGVWPPDPRSDPWLSRPMRYTLGLDLPERRIGLSAHDFVQMLGMPDVVLTRSAKVGGAPAVASRFLHRLEAVAGKERWAAATARGAIYLDYADALDQPIGEPKPIEAPAPKPPREARPTVLSVTEIEDWLRDPYTIYARHILNLRPLDPVDMPLSVADRGTAIHNTLGDFTAAYPERLPDDIVAQIEAIGAGHFAPLLNRPEARAMWWPRFLRVAAWFAGWERERRENAALVHAEISGRLSIPLDHGRIFTLTTRADRIETRRDRTYALIDYKTGTPPTGKQVRIGLSPQLSLMAAILREGGFQGIPAGASVSELTYVRLSGNDPAGQEIILDLKRDRNESSLMPDEIAQEARVRLEVLVRAFENEEQPYRSMILSMWTTRYGQYDDLSRVKEWAAGIGT